MNFIITVIGTFGYTGFFPIAPATFASFVYLVIYWLVPGGEMLAHPIVAVTTLIFSVPVATQLEKEYGHDAGRIVIDEIVGLQAALVWASPTLAGVVAVFFLFRFYDIIKPFPIRRSQNLRAGYGVVVDDFLAGIYTRITIIVIATLFPGVGRFF